MPKDRSPFAGNLDDIPDVLATESHRSGLPAPPQCVKDDKNLLETYEFVDSLLQRLREANQNDAAAQEHHSSQQPSMISEKRRRKIRNAIRREIGPFVVLGLQYILNVAQQLQQKCQNDPVLSEQVKNLLGWRLIFAWWVEYCASCHDILARYSTDPDTIDSILGQEKWSKWTYIRAAVSTSLLDCFDKKSALEIPLENILQAKQEWELIQRWVVLHITNSKTLEVEKIISQATIAEKLETMNEMLGVAQTNRATLRKVLSLDEPTVSLG